MREYATGDRCQRKVDPPAIRPTEEIEAENHRAWQEWLQGLTPDERVQLERMKLVAPAAPGKKKRPRAVVEDDDAPQLGTCDFLPSEELDPAEALMAKEDAEAEGCPGRPMGRYEIDETMRRDLVLLGYVLPAIIDAKNPRLEASLIALALEIGTRQGITVEGLSARHSIHVLALKKRIRTWQRYLDVCRASVTLLRIVISPILASRNPRLEAESIAMAARFGLSGGASMTARGEHHGVHRAAISARVRRWVKRLGLALPRECKEETANYVLFNVRREKPKTFDE